MTPADESRIDPAVVTELYAKHHAELRSFLVGVLRDSHLANDALQATFAKAVEVGHTAMKKSLKGWLFRVALNEALAIRRRQQTRYRVLQQVAWSRPRTDRGTAEAAQRVDRQTRTIPRPGSRQIIRKIDKIDAQDRPKERRETDRARPEKAESEKLK